MNDEDPIDRSSPEFWIDADDIEGVEAARRLDQQFELFPENTARGVTTPELRAEFALDGSSLRNLLRSAVPFSSLTTPKHQVMFMVANGMIDVLMQSGGVFTRSRFHIKSETAVCPEEPFIYSMPLWKADRLSRALTVIDGRVDGRKQLWQIISRINKRSKRPSWLNIAIAPIHPTAIEPWQVHDRGNKTHIDPITLRTALAYVGNAAKRQDHPNFSVAEVRDGAARALCSQAVVSAHGVGLQGVSMVVDAVDIPTVCRLLHRMSPKKTTISIADGYCFIESVSLAMAVRIPKASLPALDTVIATEPSALLKLSSKDVGLRANAATTVEVKGSPLDVSLRSTATGAVIISAIGVGRYRAQFDAMPRDEPGVLSDMSPSTEGETMSQAAPTISARVDQSILTDLLWPLEGVASHIEIGHTDRGLMVRGTASGLKLQGLLSPVG